MDDATARHLARIAKLPADVDLAVFGTAIEDAIRAFGNYGPDGNAVHRVVGRIYSLADKVVSGRVEFATQLADEFRQIPEPLRRNLAAREERLKARAEPPPPGPEEPGRLQRRAGQRAFAPLPSADELADPTTAAEAAGRLRGYLRIGGGIEEGRMRPNGHHSVAFRPLLNAPAPRKGRPANAAADELTMWVAVAFLEATGKDPPRSDYRKPGPFLRLVREVLRLAGVPHIDAAEAVRRYRAGWVLARQDFQK